MTREGVGDTVGSIEGSGWSESESESSDDCGLVLAAFAALARVVTMSSLRESFENCSICMEKLCFRGAPIVKGD